MQVQTSPCGNFSQLNIPWIDSPFFEKLLALSDLDETTKKFVKDYSDYGYAIFDPEIIDFDRLTQQIIRIFPENTRRVLDAWLVNGAVKTVATAPKILSLLRILYQREPIPFQTLNFSVGSQQRTHSETIHFNSIPSRFMCGVWVALEDTDLNNGCFFVYPGSHRLPAFDFPELGLNTTDQEKLNLYEDFIESLVLYLESKNELKKVNISLRKGQAIVWAANLLHGGNPILDLGRTRYSQVTHYFFSDCMYYLPMQSDGLRKRIYKITNISTNEIVPQFCNGKKFFQDEGLISFIKAPRAKLRATKPQITKAMRSMRLSETHLFP